LWHYCYDAVIHRKNFFQTCRASVSISKCGNLIASCTVENDDRDFFTKLFVLDRGGRLVWEMSFKGFDNLLAQAESADGTILFCPPGKKLCAFDPSGKKRWECRIGGKLSTTPRIGSDGTIFVGAADKKIYAIDVEGSVKWDFFVGGDELREFSLGFGDTVCLNSFNGEVIVLNRQGKLLMRGTWLPGNDGGRDAPLVCTDGTLICCSFDALHAIAPGGTIKWSFSLQNDCYPSQQVLATDDVVVFAPNPGYRRYHNVPQSLVAIGPDGNKAWEVPLEWPTQQGLTLTLDGIIFAHTSKALYAIQCPTGLADAPWPMSGQNPQHTNRANPKFVEPIQYGGGTPSSPAIELRSRPEKPLPEKSFTKEDILRQLDADADFPMLDNGYIHPAATRLNVFRDPTRWALVIEIVGWNNRSSGHEAIANALYCYGNWLDQRPGLADDGFLHPTRDGDAGITFDDQDVDPDARTLYVRDTLVKIPRVRKHYASLGIKLEEPGVIKGHELLRALAAEQRDLLLATDEELRQRVGDLPLVLRLQEWRHPDLSADEKPGECEAFQMIADVLVTGDPVNYHPTQPPNTHWKHWPMAGQL
jgi:outer membrane protein assembly factor BamB